MQEIADSRQQTEEHLNQLRCEEKDIREELSRHDGSMADRFRRLAKIMEERLDLGDQMVSYLVHEISTNIRRFCLSHDPPILAGYHVNDYLDEKYKDPEHAKLAKIKAAINNLEYRTRRRCEQIEHCSAEDLPELLELTRNEANERDRLATEAIKLSTEKKREIDRIRQRARELGLDNLLDEEYRDPISCYDFRMPVPNDQKLEWYNEHTSENLVETGKTITEFGSKDFLEFPPLDTEVAKKYMETSRIWRIIFHTVKEKKWSGDIGFWMDRNYHQKVQSSHDSGNSTKFDTTLCAWCSRDIDKDPLDRHIMQYDKTSPTTKRCDNCGGTAVLDKGNSREQVGDKKEENDRLAEDIINHASFYGDIFSDWRVRSLNDTIYSRKRAIQEEFSKAAFGKESIVVPKKKTTTK